MLALAWTQLQDKDSTVEAGFAIGQAQDWPSFVAAVERYQGAQQNMAFADRDGTVGMISPGLVPMRPQGDGRLPVPGWTGEHDWLGTIPPGELPRQVRPAAGLLLNANNRLVGDAYPYLLTRDWEPTLRASRLEALLGDERNLDADRFAAVQLDVASPLAQEFLPYLLAVPPAGRREREMLAGLAGWDRGMRPDRPEPLLFSAWYRELSAAVYADELGLLFADYRGLRADFMRLALTRRPVGATTSPPRPRRPARNRRRGRSGGRGRSHRAVRAGLAAVAVGRGAPGGARPSPLRAKRPPPAVVQLAAARGRRRQHGSRGPGRGHARGHPLRRGPRGRVSRHLRSGGAGPLALDHGRRPVRPPALAAPPGYGGGLARGRLRRHDDATGGVPQGRYRLAGAAPRFAAMKPFALMVLPMLRVLLEHRP